MLSAPWERVGKSGWLVLGREVETFEADLAQHISIGRVVGCGSGLDALEISLRVLGIQPGETVLTTPLSAFATTLAIIRAGGVPAFVDVGPTGLLDLAACAHHLDLHPQVRFILPVHLYGHALSLSGLEDLQRAYGVHIVEDCAQAIGATSDGRPVGSVGAISGTSFYPTKNLGCMGDGGAILTNDPQLAEAARNMRDYGQRAKYVHARLGMNSRLDELQAAILRSAMLPRLPRFADRRRAIARWYVAGIGNRALNIPPMPEGSASVWHLFPILVEGDRSRFRAHLDARGVGSGLHYPMLIPDQEALRGVGAKVDGALQNARRFAEHEVSLPIHPYLDLDDVARVIEACNTWIP